MKMCVFFLIIFLIAFNIYCGATSESTNPLWVKIFTPSLVISILAFLLMTRTRRKRRRTYRKRILTEVDLIEKAYAGKMEIIGDKLVQAVLALPATPTTIDLNDVSVELPKSDINNFNNLHQLSLEATALLSKEENNRIHEVLETFKKAKFNCKNAESGECINLTNVYYISSMAKQLQKLLRTHTK